ncbi:hypothetical protein A2U01_0074591, partial [Trifolium medium]|nr:hypothetical protein [Trifolium medium]
KFWSGSLARLRLASSSDMGPESFQVFGEKWRPSRPAMLHLAWGGSSLSPGGQNSRPATQAQIWGSASILALASPHIQLIDP